MEPERASVHRLVGPIVRPTALSRRVALEVGEPLVLAGRSELSGTIERVLVLLADGRRVGELPFWLELLVLPFVQESLANAVVVRPVSGTGRHWIEVDLACAQILDREMVVADLETTGLSPDLDEIIEIGALVIRHDKVVAEFETFVKPHRPIPPFITQLTGISNSMVSNAPTLETALSEFLAFVGERPIIAHNAAFDFGFLRAACSRALGLGFPNTPVCTVRLARQLLPNVSHSLGNLAAALGVRPANRHRALGDVYTTHQVWTKLVSGGTAFALLQPSNQAGVLVKQRGSARV